MEGIRKNRTMERANAISLEEKAKLYDLMNDEMAKQREVGYYIQDIFGFQYFTGKITLLEAMAEIEWVIKNEKLRDGNERAS